MTVRLEELLAAATKGEWKVEWDSDYNEMEERSYSWPWRIEGVCDFASEEGNEADAALIALAPDAVRLLIDMGEALRNCHHDFDPAKDECSVCSPLLARLDRLGNTT